MRVIRIFTPLTEVLFDQNVSLTEASSHHLVKVLRVDSGQIIHLFDGRGACFEACVIQLGKQVVVKILRPLPSSSESPLAIQLLIAVGKGDKMDWIVQKATELGVANIQPITCTRCAVQLSTERWQKKQQHWQAIVINACEQSGRNVVPDVAPVISLDKALQMNNNRLNLLLHPEVGAPRLTKLLTHTVAAAVSLLIGPEGGFTQEEVVLAQRHNFTLASLGSRILRMETAAISSVTLLQALLGDI
jgi:16S rRNA (uracil1498-N3)-methyltransferase